MKEIWINLELYFESYDFYNFKEFSGIFLSLFKLNLNLLYLCIQHITLGRTDCAKHMNIFECFMDTIRHSQFFLH